jgi:hypothetical protein
MLLKKKSDFGGGKKKDLTIIYRNTSMREITLMVKNLKISILI